MAKRELDLHIVELDQIFDKQTDVSLMPCPCGGSIVRRRPRRGAGGGPSNVACGGCHGSWSESDQQAAQIAIPAAIAFTGRAAPLLGSAYAAAQLAANAGTGIGMLGHGGFDGLGIGNPGSYGGSND